MVKLILLSSVVALIAIPAVAASDPHPRRGLRRMLVLMMLFNFFYLFALRVILPRVG